MSLKKNTCIDNKNVYCEVFILKYGIIVIVALEHEYIDGHGANAISKWINFQDWQKDKDILRKVIIPVQTRTLITTTTTVPQHIVLLMSTVPMDAVGTATNTAAPHTHITTAISSIRCK